ncbi:alpha/beta fold hydrolase [Aetokthonos hydrillicola Thurmond2011]|jgi:alpha-beta hydrolase superfamily lysophospholipase|uniref:Alpha/beta fold hydrolase n=2 Tax=Aetokthonos TaxID=1550243 RepID=A0AAP5MDR6_9CYAN|nr:alpha/beta fold hydrolase [Aetokthonos hydrillicola]MBO3457930.1 alpha/beta hydrolase [Aetokthonos hydrillicola CCALA 1050]MBW4587420.1 alpha/beta fold hydrolase [Aetokthonos hydrillicola CCALA 1050]MDR9899988.1 alpha/beta fold hydrolase [Aetokthonos hydrillicola Thurmond2011]
MKLFFTDQNFSYNLLRTVGHSVYGGADIGECLATVARIEDGNYEHWYNEWHNTAQRVEHHASKSLKTGNPISARQAYLRASNYYRTAEFFLHSNQQDPRILETWGRSETCFRQAVELFTPQIEAIEIPFEETTLPGYFYRNNSTNQPCPTVIFYPGFDSTLEELHFFGASAAAAQGYNCLTFAGPGQGGVIRKQNIPFRPDWETVVNSVVNYASNLSEVDTKQLILLGQSFGGLLAIRAVAYNSRFAACIFHGGIFDLYDSFLELFPPELSAQLSIADDTSINQLVSAVMTANPGANALLGHGMYVMGVSSGAELVAKIKRFTLKNLAQRVTCPVLIIDGEQDHFLPGHGKQLYDMLISPKDYLLFSATEGAEEHCQVGALALCHEQLFNWLKQQGL